MRKYFMRSFSKIIYSYYKHFSRVLQLSALFLLDDKNVIWIWQGWWPDSGTEDQSGSKTVRWQAERRAAMMIAIRYWRKTRNAQTTNLPIYLIWAGLEPLQFINLFPEWMYRDDVAELNIEVCIKVSYFLCCSSLFILSVFDYYKKQRFKNSLQNNNCSIFTYIFRTY